VLGPRTGKLKADEMDEYRKTSDSKLVHYTEKNMKSLTGEIAAQYPVVDNPQAAANTI